MKIEFVNHSCFIIEHAGKRVICDPWFEGAVFNNGWNLISKTKFQYEDFKNIDYIWFSHEHPDHFYPPNLKKIPDEYKANITVLFQNTIDKKVVEYCKGKNFKSIIELKPDEWVELALDFKILCEHFAEGDSWICFKGNDLTYLNTNDCGIRNVKEGRKIKSKVGNVDILLTQFSYAYWAGNPEQTEYRKRIAEEKLGWLKLQCDLFRPAVVIPIASYIYFSHEENNYLNDLINTPQKVFDYINSETKAQAVILYTGENYFFGENHNSKASIDNYERDLRQIQAKKDYFHSPSIELQRILEFGNTFIEEINDHNAFYLIAFLKSTTVYLLDLNKSIRISTSGVTVTDIDYEKCDAAMWSDSLAFCFKFPYGLDTTQINGRLRKPAKGNYHNFYNFFRINHLKNRGENPNNISYLSFSVWRKVLTRLRLHEQ